MATKIKAKVADHPEGEEATHIVIEPGTTNEETITLVEAREMDLKVSDPRLQHLIDTAGDVAQEVKDDVEREPEPEITQDQVDAVTGGGAIGDYTLLPGPEGDDRPVDVVLGALLQAVDALQGLIVKQNEVLVDVYTSIERVGPSIERLAFPEHSIVGPSGDVLDELRSIVEGAKPEGMVPIVPSDIGLDDKVRVSHLGFESAYTGHQGVVTFVPPDGQWPFVVKFHSGDHPEPGDRVPTVFARDEIEKVLPESRLIERAQ